MSQELERVYTINLGKVLLSPDNRRAKRAINMIKEFARHHMKTQQIKIEEDLSHQIWERGIRHPPRKIRVRMTKTDEGFVLVSPYEEEIEKPKKEKQKPEPVKEEETLQEPKEEVAKEETIQEETVKEEIIQKEPEIKEKPKKETTEPKKSKLKKEKTEKSEKPVKKESKIFKRI